MANDLQIITPTAPELRKAGTLPSLPAWLITRVKAVSEEMQQDPEGFRDRLTLPKELMLTPDQRQAIEGHLRNLRSLLAQTSENNGECEAKTLLCLTKIFLALPSRKSDETGTQAKAEAHMVALDDVPYWAVEAAARCWYRGTAGNDERGNPYDCSWAPAPADLRRIALRISSDLHVRIRELERTLGAVEFVDCSKELERGRAAMHGLLRTLADGGDISALTLEGAAEFGRKP
mgnify:CR=1 FL=1